MSNLCTASAAVRLMMKYPFWCELYYSMKVIEDDTIPTLCTDGHRMWVNPKFWATLSLDHKITALAHESCHKMLHHCTRGLDFMEPYGNIAADIVVHNLLVKNGFSIHPNWVQPEPQYDGWTFEAVYKAITKDVKKPPKGGKGGEGGEEGPAGPGSGPPQPGDVPEKWSGVWADIKKFKGSPAQVENFEQKIEQAVAKAVATAKAMGHAPAGVEMAMDMVAFRVEEKWYDHLHRYMQSLRSAEYNWARLDKKRASMYEICAPDIYSEALGEVVVYVDASGSCYDQATQANFAGHINAILSEAKPSKVHVIYFDTQVHKHIEMDPGEIEFAPQPQGGGGTSFEKLFPWLEDMGINPALAIVLTDMMGGMPNEEDAPQYPVVWASTEAGYVGPFGETIYVK